MPRARAKQLKAEDEDLPIRNSPRKRKLVEYAEIDGDDDSSSDVAENPQASDSANENLTPSNDRKRSQASSKSKASTPRQRKTKEAKKVQSKDNAKTSVSLVESDQEDIIATTASKSAPLKPRKKDEQDTQALDSEQSEPSPEDNTEKPKRRRKTKEEKEAEAMPLAPRTPNLRMFVGAHTSIAKGVENAITNALHIGANGFACFLKSQRKWDNPSLKDENRDAFRSHLVTHNFDAAKHIVPHGSYLVNLASADPDMSKKSYDAFLDDLQRCEALGIKHYNFHPGAAGQSPLEEAIARLAANLNKALSATTAVIPLLENMATRGSIIGGRFSDLSSVIKLIKPEHQHRIGVCIDTCHAFASGYDLRSPEAFKATLQDFDETVGIKYLKALHLNDSKAPFASNRDLHQNIGVGFLGLRAFHNVMNEPRFQGLPLILETPCEKPDPDDPKKKRTLEDKSVWAREIKLLESLIGMDPSGPDFKNLEKDLSDIGKTERAQMQKQFDEKIVKEKKKIAKEREQNQKSVKDMFGGRAKKD